ncbi:SPOR domain-containing protein [Variovorax sp. UMC13]|uniref:SPOR domain-containing protein n=1 Tax=Variovorax sp. UMC13 TaxID=1862326 RepID=UPI001601746B|nr:SPOR domain-containing protein [Variovorax sp. UMC13]MBB1599432.1 sporulation protein [Variovorax sp. UMC13]
MAFFKFRSRGQPANEGRNASVAAAPAESVDAMRRRARHRLLGAAVLVLVGVIGFPLLFDTQPRPVAVDIPIEIPDRNKVAPLPAPVAPAAPVAQAPAPAPAPAPAAPAPDNRTRVASNSGTSGGIITETADGRELPSERPVAAAPPAETRPEVKPKPEPKPESKPEVRHETKPEPKPAVAAKPPADDGARARALLDGKPPAAAAAAAVKPAAATDDDGRFVVQVGAFAEAEKARDVRQKLEKAGLKTYTNVAKTADGERTRVRVGPFASRAEAERAAGRVKGLSLPAAVLSL